MISEDCRTLLTWMLGSFSNAAQAQANPQGFPHILLAYRPLPPSFFPGVGFYSEQAYEYDLWSPYRQGVHRVIDRGEDVYIENYALKDPALFAGAARESSILAKLTAQDIERRVNCSMVFTRHGDRFRGGVEGRECFSYRSGGKSYLVSEVEIAATTLQSLDRGFDLDTHEPLWGSDTGAFIFDKTAAFPVPPC